MSMTAGSSESEEAGRIKPPSHQRRRRGWMQRPAAAVFYALAAFAVIQLGLSILEIPMPEIRDPLYGRRLRLLQKSLRAKPVKPWNVVMVGSSRTLFGFNPGPTERTWDQPGGRPISAFNFGVSNGSALTELLMARRLKQDGVKPDLLLVEVMPLFLSGQTHCTDFGCLCLPTTRPRWRDLALVEHYAKIPRPGLRPDWLLASSLPWYSQRCTLTSLVAPDLLPNEFRLDKQWANLDKFGRQEFLKRLSPEEYRRAMEVWPVLFRTYKRDFQLGGPACDALSELLASCRRDGIPTALVFMPEGPAFRSCYSPESMREVQDFVERLSRNYSAPIIDCRAWIDEDGFMDSSHLLTEAGARFADRLGREGIAPLLHRQCNDEKTTRRLAEPGSPLICAGRP